MRFLLPLTSCSAMGCTASTAHRRTTLRGQVAAISACCVGEVGIALRRPVVFRPATLIHRQVGITVAASALFSNRKNA